jgi:Na+/serine symporter
VLTTIALIIGLVAVNLFKPGVGMNVDLSHVDTSSVATYIEQTHKQTTDQFLLNIIPNTFVGAFSEGNVLQVLYISVLCGFALSWMGQAGKPINDLIEASSQMLFRIVAVVMWAAPLGAFGAIAFTVEVRHRFPVLARRAVDQLLFDMPHLRVRRALANCLLVRFQPPQVHSLYPGRTLDCICHDILGNSAAAHDCKA